MTKGLGSVQLEGDQRPQPSHLNAPLFAPSVLADTNMENDPPATGDRPIAITPAKASQVAWAPPSPVSLPLVPNGVQSKYLSSFHSQVTPLRIRLPSAAALGKLRRNNGLNGDYWTCFKTPEKDDRFVSRSRYGSIGSSPHSRMGSRPLKRPRSEPECISVGSTPARK